MLLFSFLNKHHHRPWAEWIVYAVICSDASEEQANADTLWRARTGSGRGEGQLCTYCSPPWGTQISKGLHPMRSYSIKAQPRDNDICSHLEVQGGLWDVCFPLWKLELWPMHWILTLSHQDVPQTLKGNSADFLFSCFAPTTLQV